jgi:acyl-CoA thioesterase-2
MQESPFPNLPGYGLGGESQGDVDLHEVLELEEIDTDLYRAPFVDARWPTLYGGQVLAQALLAAGRTVGERLPHSLHGYFLRGGSPGRPTVFRVDRDREGRTYAARRVVALQGGEVILNLSASFTLPDTGPELQLDAPPPLDDPETLPVYVFPGLLDFEARMPEQPVEDTPWPLRYWARAAHRLGEDRLMHAAALTYLSDTSSGVGYIEADVRGNLTSLDHAMWFHRDVDLDDWVLVELVPHVVGGGRGWYTGSVFDRTGVLVASLTQESLFRYNR